MDDLQKKNSKQSPTKTPQKKRGWTMNNVAYGVNKKKGKKISLKLKPKEKHEVLPRTKHH